MVYTSVYSIDFVGLSDGTLVDGLMAQVASDDPLLTGVTEVPVSASAEMEVWKEIAQKGPGSADPFINDTFNIYISTIFQPNTDWTIDCDIIPHEVKRTFDPAQPDPAVDYGDSLGFGQASAFLDATYHVNAIAQLCFWDFPTNGSPEFCAVIFVLPTSIGVGRIGGGSDAIIRVDGAAHTAQAFGFTGNTSNAGTDALPETEPCGVSSIIITITRPSDVVEVFQGLERINPDTTIQWGKYDGF